MLTEKDVKEPNPCIKDSFYKYKRRCSFKRFAHSKIKYERTHAL